ncbi:elastase-like [Haliotis rufescens]|uniref:elastase-like n=1 Tax=Haliotis rufescens TaxID=6454 RepID=UPI00201EAEA6|nr:elastase-like [Haliotis rufescens]
MMASSVLWVSLLLLVCVHHLEAAKRVNARQVLLEGLPEVVPGYTRRRSARDTETTRTRNMREVFQLAGGESFQETEEANTVQGTRQVKMKERYHGQEVFGASVTLTMTEESGVVVDATGDYVNNIEEDVDESRGSITEDELFAILIAYAGDQSRTGDIKGRSIAYEVYTDEHDVAHHVAIVEYLIETDDVQKRPRGIIDTRTREVMTYFDSLETCFDREDEEMIGGNKKIGIIHYDGTHRCLDLRQENGICYLENEHVKVIDMNNSAIERSTGVARFDCAGNLNDSINGAYSPAIDALYYGTQIVKMFKEWYDTDPIRGGLTLRVHFSRNVMNAFWNGQNVSFGDGRRRFIYPLVSLDIAAHEIAHGFTEQHSGLIYIGQSGGLNEAFSDMAGEMAELYTNATDWQVGADIMYRRPMRFFANPEKDGRSISHMDKFSNRMSPHTTSGIYNKVFYLLAHEYGLNPIEVFRVFLHANKMYWQPMTNFISGACDVMQAAYDMGQPGEPFVRAFQEVGIEVCDVEDHLLHLRLNRTKDQITVSNESSPAFGIDLPDWSKEILVEATSDSGDDITITVFSEPWKQINDSTVPLVQSSNRVTYDVSGAGPHFYVIRLSTGGSASTNVGLTAGYTCQENYSTSNHKFTLYYNKECGNA